MISTKDLRLLPDSKKLQEACKAMAVLDAILCQEWVYRYHSYNSDWSEDEQFFEMRNGEGDQLLVLFKNEGTVINGFFAEAEQGDKTLLTQGLPQVFHEFMFGEPVNSAGTTFCVWKTEGLDWATGIPVASDDHSEELLSPLDGKPTTYHKWATDYFKGNYKEEGIPAEVVTAIFDQEPLTDEMILALIPALEDRELLLEDLAEISFPYHINS
ncbi:hypothetical protein SAMN06265348_105170 [Pedobacter westerhofensis]|uniref:Uncharacterized protein n=1 Tax=Pedobacter westerhofensis TaxID=425512 RepID=A0A521DB99_9SPHI|nr:hypothetical protein [Pedobacter westerhofensis]SMO68997.1 hypothetical protein SAMN06265348_105170 [Pedobacter westerhofensis]